MVFSKRDSVKKKFKEALFTSLFISYMKNGVLYSKSKENVRIPFITMPSRTAPSAALQFALEEKEE